MYGYNFYILNYLVMATISVPNSRLHIPRKWPCVPRGSILNTDLHRGTKEHAAHGVANNKHGEIWRKWSVGQITKATAQPVNIILIIISASQVYVHLINAR